MTQKEENKVTNEPVEPIEVAIPDEAPKQDRPVVKSPKPKMVNVKLVRKLDPERCLVETLGVSGDFYIVPSDVFTPGERHAEIVASDHVKPHDWAKMLDEILPTREEMIAVACAHLVKNGMVELSDLNDNAKRSKAFRQMLNYSIPKSEDKE